MTDFLVKCFVKDHDKTEDPQVRTRYGILASIVGICCNLLLFASKLFIGVLVNSVSVMADAFNNLSDAASSIIGFIGVRMQENRLTAITLLGMGGLNIFLLLLWLSWLFRWDFPCLKLLLEKCSTRKKCILNGSPC